MSLEELFGSGKLMDPSDLSLTMNKTSHCSLFTRQMMFIEHSRIHFSQCDCYGKDAKQLFMLLCGKSCW